MRVRGKKRARLVPRPKGLNAFWRRDWPRDDGKDGFPAGQNASWFCPCTDCRYTRKGPDAGYRCPIHRVALRWGGEKGLVWERARGR